MYATLDDVKRVMGISDDDESREEEIIAALEAAESWLERKLNRTYQGGTVTTAFYRVRSDSVLRIPDDQGTVLSVTDGAGTPLGYQQVGRDRVRLSASSGWSSWPSLVDRRTWYIDEVRVTYTAPAGVPAAIREAAALLAADLVPDVVVTDAEGNVVGNIVSERIGDYQYKVDESSLEAGVSNARTQAMRLLRPFFPKRKVAVV